MEKVSLLLAHTVIVGEKTPEVSKAVKNVAYSFNEDDEEVRAKVKPEVNNVEAFSSKAALKSDNLEIPKEAARRQH
ncbi:hypothetical protein RJ641_023780 [Dillenia turbinata]|uniref:Uncharacterized protein n=1 Tax=Dillenia turbinata TaxID=194707 RepID=A0AAN8YT37_9MAGN